MCDCFFFISDLMDAENISFIFVWSSLTDIHFIHSPFIRSAFIHSFTHHYFIIHSFVVNSSYIHHSFTIHSSFIHSFINVDTTARRNNDITSTQWRPVRCILGHLKKSQVLIFDATLGFSHHLVHLLPIGTIF